jgi:hypothetical protein
MERATAVRQSDLKSCMLKVHLKITKLLPCFLNCYRQTLGSMKGPLRFHMNKLSNYKLTAVLLYQYSQLYIVTLPFRKVMWHFCMEIKLSVPRQTLMSTEISAQLMSSTSRFISPFVTYPVRTVGKICFAVWNKSRREYFWGNDS